MWFREATHHHYFFVEGDYAFVEKEEQTKKEKT
jgi:hypothetical protein